VLASQGNFHLSKVTYQPVKRTSDWWKLPTNLYIFLPKSLVLYEEEEEGSRYRAFWIFGPSG
jgi:hypothetical protein